MKAVVITTPGGPEVLQLKEVTTPTPAAEQVLVKIHAAGVNRLDLIQREGHYPVPAGYPQDIPGVEFAGVVESIGSGVQNLQIGDKVFGLTGGGAYAEYVVIEALLLARIPKGISFIEAAAIPEVFITAYDAMVTQGRLSRGECILVNAIGSGVGTAAIQIANAIGARIIGTARTIDKLEQARKLGLKDGLLVDSNDFVADVMKTTNNRGVDVVLELVGGEYVQQDIKCLAQKGRLLLVGLLAGSKTEIDLSIVLGKRLEIRGTTLRARSLEEKIVVMKTFAEQVVPLIISKQIKAVIDNVYPLIQADQAHRYMATNKSFGKIVLEV